MSEPVRLMIVDDSPSTRTMLHEALALEDGITVVGEAGSGREAVRIARELGPDVILMDVRMSDGDGIEATRALVDGDGGPRVLGLSWSDDPRTVRAMIDAGAIGYLVKGGGIDDLGRAVKRAFAGGMVLDPRIASAIVPDPKGST
jgi:DNA-binding NarL/FixJ family response regulator